MKLLIQSIIFSIVVHVIYFGGSLVHGWILTRYYVPDILKAHENVYYLQNEVAFGYVISSIYCVLSFVMMSLIGAVLIHLFRKFRIAKRST